MCHTGYSYSLRAGSGRNWFRPDPAHKLSANPFWRIPLLCVQWRTPDDGHRNCSKHIEFYSKNKLEKLMQLVGFIIRIFHNVRSSERQIHNTTSLHIHITRRWSLIFDIVIFCYNTSNPFVYLYWTTHTARGPDSSVGIATDYGLDGPGSNPGGYEIFCPSRPALGPTQPPVQWVPSLSRG